MQPTDVYDAADGRDYLSSWSDADHRAWHELVRTPEEREAETRLRYDAAIADIRRRLAGMEAGLDRHRGRAA